MKRAIRDIEQQVWLEKIVLTSQVARHKQIASNGAEVRVREPRRRETIHEDHHRRTAGVKNTGPTKDRALKLREQNHRFVRRPEHRSPQVCSARVSWRSRRA